MRAAAILKAPLKPAARYAAARWLQPRIPATFICGPGHSGSTLLNRILSHHSAVYTPGIETGIFLTDPPQLGHLARLYWRAALKRAEHLIEKTPDHIYHLDHITAEVPGARFVFTIRDGRDVAASYGTAFGDYDQGATAWIRAAAIVAVHRERPNAFVFRYEQFVETPEPVLKALCCFLDLDYEPIMLDYHKAPRPYGEHRGDAPIAGAPTDIFKLRAWQINQPIFDGRNRWQKELPAPILDRLVNGDGASLMKVFGYR